MGSPIPITLPRKCGISVYKIFQNSGQLTSGPPPAVKVADPIVAANEAKQGAVAGQAQLQSSGADEE